MIFSLLYRAGLASLLAIALANEDIVIKTIPKRPSEDPFYTPPVGYENSAPGTILRFRAPPGILPVNHAASYQFLYRTTDAIGNPEATVTTIIVPHLANLSRVVSFHDFEDASSPDCATSFALQLGSGLNSSQSKGDVIQESLLLGKGWVVAIPDHEGPKAAAFSGVQAGHAALDGIRAVLASHEITGISPDASVQMWGYSGGSIPTEWAAELQPTYAPELIISGAAIGGAIADLRSTALTINKGHFAGFAVVGILGLMKSYPILTDYFQGQMIPEKELNFTTALTACSAADISRFENQDIGEYFEGGMDILQDPIVESIFVIGGAMGITGLPTIPLFFYKTIGDQVSSIGDTDVLVDKLCGMGVESLSYDRNSYGEHVSENFLGLQRAMQFLDDRFNGVPAQTGCRTSNVTVTWTDWLVGRG